MCSLTATQRQLSGICQRMNRPRLLMSRPLLPPDMKIHRPLLTLEHRSAVLALLGQHPTGARSNTSKTRGSSPAAECRTPGAAGPGASHVPPLSRSPLASASASASAAGTGAGERGAVRGAGIQGVWEKGAELRGRVLSSSVDMDAFLSRTLLQVVLHTHAVLCVCVCVCVCACVCVCVYKSMHADAQTCACKCVHVCVHIYTHLSYTYTYAPVFPPPTPPPRKGKSGRNG